MKSPPEPESTRALSEISLFPTRRDTDKISLESDEEEPVKVIAEMGTEATEDIETVGANDETGVDAEGGGVDGSSVTRDSVADDSV